MIAEKIKYFIGKVTLNWNELLLKLLEKLKNQVNDFYINLLGRFHSLLLVKYLLCLKGYQFKGLQ